jgi:uncharacterized protein (DUF305 family)
MSFRFVVGMLALVLLGACRESAPETPAHTADTHQRDLAQPNGRAAPASASLVAQRAQQRLRTVARTGSIDHDFSSLLLEHFRGARELAAVERATGRDAALRALADTLRREWDRESVTLGHLATRTHDNESEAYTRQYQEFTRDVQAVCDSAAHYRPRGSSDPDADFAASLAAHLRTGLLLVREGIAHGSDPALIALAHRFHHDQRLHLQQVEAWSTAQTTPTNPTKH